MPRLPNSQRAILDPRKIEDYCLNPGHPRGRHKARLFREALGIERTDASWLREVMLAAAEVEEATEISRDAFGIRWRIDVEVRRHTQAALVRSVWIIRNGEDMPRFVTCWVL